MKRAKPNIGIEVEGYIIKNIIPALSLTLFAG